MPRLQDTESRYITMGVPLSVYMWPEVGNEQGRISDDVFVFQYWPETLDDSYNPTYDEKTVPGGTHPLYQWVGGSGRDISFTAIFTAEIEPDSKGFSANVNTSMRYNVDVRAALAKLNSFLRPQYSAVANASEMVTIPPPRLFLVLGNTRLGGDRDEVLVILKSMSVSYQAWFTTGYPRIAEAQLTFSEVVQHRNSSTNISDIRFIGAAPFKQGGQSYQYRGGR